MYVQYLEIQQGLELNITQENKNNKKENTEVKKKSKKLR